MPSERTDILVVDAEGSGGMAHYASGLAEGLSWHRPAMLYTIASDDGLVPGSLTGRWMDRTRRGARVRRYYNPMRFSRLARHLGRTYKPRIVHVTSHIPAMTGLFEVLRSQGVRTVGTVHDPKPHHETRTSWSEFKTRIDYSLMLPRALARCDAIHVHSRLHAEQLVAMRGAKIGAKTYVVRHGGGISKSIAEGNQAIPELAGIIPGARTILFFGRIHPYKGIDLLLDVFPAVVKSVPHAQLVIAGAGQMPEVPESVRNHVIVINRFIDDREIKALFANANFVVLPYRDGTQSGVIALAAAMKLPAVVTRVGALPELVVDAETGLIVPPDHVSALAAALVQLAAEPDNTREMGVAAHRFMESRYSWRAVAAEHIEQYRTRFGYA